MFPRLPPATRALIVANILVYLAQALTRDAFTGLVALQPVGPYFHVW